MDCGNSLRQREPKGGVRFPSPPCRSVVVGKQMANPPIGRVAPPPAPSTRAPPLSIDVSANTICSQPKTFQEANGKRPPDFCHPDQQVIRVDRATPCGTGRTLEALLEPRHHRHPTSSRPRPTPG